MPDWGMMLVKNPSIRPYFRVKCVPLDSHELLVFGGVEKIPFEVLLSTIF